MFGIIVIFQVFPLMSSQNLCKSLIKKVLTILSAMMVNVEEKNMEKTCRKI